MAQTKSRRSAKAAVSTSKLISEVSAKFSEVSRKITREVLQAFIAYVESHVIAGNRVRIDKLGILTVKDRAARKGRNPQTGAVIHIPATKKVSFRVSSSLKDALGIKKKKSTPKKNSKKRK